MEEFPSQLIDYGKHFTIHKRFKDREEFIEEVKQIGEQQNVFVIFVVPLKLIVQEVAKYG